MEHKAIKIAALMTAPRHEIVLARNYIELALKKCGIPLTISGGVFYGQCMQRMLSDLANEGADYALTVDFDSVFTEKHVQRLVSIACREQGIDAVAAIQPKRGSGEILAALGKAEQSLEWDGYPVKVDTAHFGLTVINLEKLRNVPKPWFMSVPDENGEWEGRKVDDDVYFWRAWQESGNTVYIDPGCRLGHMEEMVTVFDEKMQIQHHYPVKWNEISASTVD